MKLLREYLWEWAHNPAPEQKLGYQDTVKHFLYFAEQQMKHATQPEATSPQTKLATKKTPKK